MSDQPATRDRLAVGTIIAAQRGQGRRQDAIASMNAARSRPIGGANAGPGGTGAARGFELENDSIYRSRSPVTARLEARDEVVAH
jgi:hypothetical protein